MKIPLEMGVELDRPNVFVHLDWMQDATRDQRSVKQRSTARTAA